MSEKNILAYFKSPEAAEAVSRKLQSLRVIDMSIDRFSKYPGGARYSGNNPLTGDIPSLATMTLNSTLDSHSAGILAAADSSASGMSHGGEGGPTGRDILLTVVLDSEVFDQALSLIEEAGGML
ncbi:hypothetical protein A3844_04965 [Paenibacillus helianthi]|uniref:DUF3341 domain-containing protein n=1 Tax=Paenibacillus helianthi TaxID=1349432 RepID=A0ABX3EX46_9BACL|nr:hypothetical protein [Paenibacillus helianthi]OKP91183.1 hypothetical protein A3844_04965 [Paenibacillus helianthi]